jgi:HNH endonuclease
MRPTDIDIPIAELRERLRYDPEAGQLIWVRGKFAGKVAGCAHKGYIRIDLSRGGVRRAALAHRIIWALETDEWPIDRIDHRNREKAGNRFSNLRPATMPEQMQNKSIYKNNTSGLPGASFHKRIGKWQSYINVGGRRQYLGYFDTPEEAHAVYLKAKSELHPFQPVP